MAMACTRIVPEESKIPINITTLMTKATDTAYETGDAVGLYVVNTPAELKQNGNHADNVRFTFDGDKWAADNQLYWYDDKTTADFYTYYPYISSASTNALNFSVQKDQSTEAAYKSSEFLCGVVKGVVPTSDPVLINTKHLMSCIRVELKAGLGWTDSDINAAKVTISGLKTSAKINLADVSISADGSTADISPLPIGKGVWKALVVPQNVVNTELIKITVGNNDYTLKTSVNLASGKQHKCTITINRTSEGINIGIDPWEDGDEFGGTVE